MGTTLPQTTPNPTGNGSTTHQQPPTTTTNDTSCKGTIIGLASGLGGALFVMCIVCVVLIVIICRRKGKQPKAYHIYEGVDELPMKTKKTKTYRRSSGKKGATSVKPASVSKEGAPEIHTRPPNQKSRTPEIPVKRPTKQQSSSNSGEESSSSNDEELGGVANPAFKQNERSSEMLSGSEIKDKGQAVKTDKTPIKDTKQPCQQYTQEEIYEVVETPPVARHAPKTRSVQLDVHASGSIPVTPQKQVFHAPTTTSTKTQDTHMKPIKQRLSTDVVKEPKTEENEAQDENKRETSASNKISEKRIGNIDETKQTDDERDTGAIDSENIDENKREIYASSEIYETRISNIKETEKCGAQDETDKTRVEPGGQLDLNKAQEVPVKPMSSENVQDSGTNEIGTQGENGREIISASDIKKNNETESSDAHAENKEKKEGPYVKTDTMRVENAGKASGDTKIASVIADKESGTIPTNLDSEENWEISGFGSLSDHNQEIYMEVNKRFNSMRTKSLKE